MATVLVREDRGVLNLQGVVGAILEREEGLDPTAAAVANDHDDLNLTN